MRAGPYAAAVPRPTVQPFADEHLDPAAEALAARHRGHRAAQPLLDPRYAEAAACRAEIEALGTTDGASGAAAHDGSRLSGFVLGAPRPAPVWGPNVWIEVAGHAADDPETLRDTYAAAAQPWVDAGRTAHYVVVPVHDAAMVDAWFRLGFGLQHVHAARPTPDPATLGPVPPAVTLRAARRTDVRVLAELDLLLPAHQELSPCFSAGEVPGLEEAMADWEDDLGDDRFATWVAEVDGDVVGSVVACPLTVSNGHRGLAAPNDAGYLGQAIVHPGARGRGIGRVLGEQALRWSAEQGYPSTVTDWRATNLLSSRAWPALGFEPTFLRLHRVVGY